MALCANWVESVFDLKVTGICFFTKVDILVELLWCWICFNYFVHKFRVRLILHGITSHALNPFGWGWGGVKNVQFSKVFFCDNHFEFVVFLGLFWWIHSDITRYIHVTIYIYTYIYTYTYTYKYTHLFWNVAIWKKYMKYNNFCFLTKKYLFFCVYYNNELYIISHVWIRLKTVMHQ